MLIWFAVAGLLFFFCVYLFGMDIPLTNAMGDLWNYSLGVVSGLAGGILFWRLAIKANADWKLMAAVLAPLALACLVGTWRLWSEEEIVSPVCGAILPCVAVAYWASRTGLAGGAGIALLVPSLFLIGGTAWYLKAWNDPRWQIRLNDLVAVAGSAGAMGEVMTKAGVAKEESDALVIQRTAAAVRKSHWKAVRCPAQLTFAGVVVCCLLWWLSPQLGWLALAAAPLGAIAPAIFWWRSRANWKFRLLFLGRQGFYYEGLGLCWAVFLAAQVAWFLRTVLVKA